MIEAINEKIEVVLISRLSPRASAEIYKIRWRGKSYGQSYALGKKSNDPKYLASLLMKLTEKMGRRLRRAGKTARGIHVGFSYIDGSYWHKGKIFDREMFTTDGDARILQEALFETGEERKREVSKALDRLNDRYGEYTVIPALMLGRQNEVVDRIAFGGVKDLADLYQG